MIKGVDDDTLRSIAKDFKIYEERGYDENTLSQICFSSLVLRDVFVDNTLDEEPLKKCQKLKMISVRRDKWKPRHLGPMISRGKPGYDWDLEPDTIYAVSITMLDKEYREKIYLGDIDHFWPRRTFQSVLT